MGGQQEIQAGYFGKTLVWESDKFVLVYKHTFPYDKVQGDQTDYFTIPKTGWYQVYNESYNCCIRFEKDTELKINRGDWKGSQTISGRNWNYYLTISNNDDSSKSWFVWCYDKRMGTGYVKENTITFDNYTLMTGYGYTHLLNVYIYYRGSHKPKKIK